MQSPKSPPHDATDASSSSWLAPWLALALLALAPAPSAAGTQGPFLYCDDAPALAALARAGTPLAAGACLPAVPLAQRQDVGVGDKTLQPSSAASCTSAEQSIAGACAPASVFVTISTNTLEPVDMVSRTFSIDFYINIVWRDDRYFLDTLAQDVNIDPSDWWPSPELINIDQADQNNKLEWQAWVFSAQVGAFGWSRADARVAAEPDNATWIMGVARAHATLYAAVDMHEFPFDGQTIEILLESVNWPANQLVFFAVPSLIDGVLPAGVTLTSAVPGWTVTSTGVSIGQHFYPTFNQSYSRLVVSVELVRQSFYWTSRVVLCVVLSVLMSIFVLSLPAEDGGDRMSNVMTVFLGMVGWEYVISSSTPMVGYNTRLDNFMMQVPRARIVSRAPQPPANPTAPARTLAQFLTLASIA